MNIVETGKTLGARIDGVDLSRPLDDATFLAIKQALGRYGVLWYSHQRLSATDLAGFAARFGTLEINVANSY